MAGFNDGINQAKQFWATRTLQQRIFLLAGTGATIVLLAVFGKMIGTPEYKPLFTGLEAADAQTLGTQLDAQGIPHQTSSDGKTISVPADKLDAARLKTAEQGNPHSGRLGFELFDKMSWGQTEFDQKVTYQRALEGELERTIETLSDVESARVHLVMPTDSIFLDRQRSAKASVIVKLRGKGLGRESTLAIARLVAGAVDELKPEDVSIIDADSARPLGLRKDGQDDEDGIDARLTQTLVRTLEPVVGVDKIRASVNVDHSLGSSEESQEKYDPAVSALLSEQRTEDTAGATLSSGVPGTSSNMPVAKQDKSDGKAASTTASASSTQPTGQSSKTETAQYGVNRVVVHTMMPSGRIDRITAAILVDDAIVKTTQGLKTTVTKRKRTPEELAKIREIAAAVIGFEEKRGDTLTVQNMPFDAQAAEAELAAPNLMEKVQKTVTDYSPAMRPVWLLALFAMVYFLVLRPIQGQALKPALANAAGQPALAAAGPSGPGVELPAFVVSEIAGGSARALQLKDQTVDLVKLKPAVTARVLQAWLREEQS